MKDEDGDLAGGDVTPGTVRSLPSDLDGDQSDRSSSPGKVTYQQSASSSSNVNLNNLDGVFPLTLTDLRDYFLFMTDKNHARSRYTGWLECAAF